MCTGIAKKIHDSLRHKVPWLETRSGGTLM